MKIIKIGKLQVLYTGIVSPESIHNGSEDPWRGLLDRFDIPDGWTSYGHHMTINLGKAKDPSLLGQEVVITVKALGQDENVMAVSVETSISSKNENPHITIATSPQGEARQSNDIQNWQPIQPFQLKGIVSEVSAGGVIITDAIREQQLKMDNIAAAQKKEIADDKLRKRQAENDHLQSLGFEGAKTYLRQQFPNLPEQAILGKMKGAGFV